MSFLVSVVAGARRFAHTDWLRADKALHALLGIEHFPGTDTVRNLFKRFGQGHIEAFWRPLWKWLLGLSWPVPADGFSLDLDSTVFQRSGHQADGSESRPYPVGEGGRTGGAGRLVRPLSGGPPDPAYRQSRRAPVLPKATAGSVVERGLHAQAVVITPALAATGRAPQVV